MATLEELRAENTKLKAIKQTHEDFEKMNAEKRELKRENFAMRHEKGLAVASRMGRGFRRMGAGVSDWLQDKNVSGKKRGKNSRPFQVDTRAIFG